MAHLERQGRVQDVVRLVEAWAAQGEPTLPARVSHARALVQLCLVDRAWAKLRELYDADLGGVDVVVLLTNLFIDRGWPQQARKPLERALASHPDHPQLIANFARLTDIVAPPSGDDVEGLPVELQLRIAERHLFFNNQTKARAILERLRRSHPGHARVGDLLWAMDGDFGLPDDDLTTLCARWGPDPLALFSDLPEEGEHTDQTESVTAAELHGHLGPEPEGRSFPQLFRGFEPSPPAGTAPERERDEVTAITSLSALAALDAGDWASSPGEDTQIARVVAKPGAVAVPLLPPKGGFQPLLPPGSDLVADFDVEEAPTRIGATASFDLSNLQRAPQRPLPPALLTDLPDGPEREDDDVVIVVAPPAAPRLSERLTTKAPAPERVDLKDETADWARQAPPPIPTPSAPPPPPVAPEPAPLTAPQRAAAWVQTLPWWVVPAALGAGIVLIGGLLGMTMQVMIHLMR